MGAALETYAGSTGAKRRGLRAWTSGHIVSALALAQTAVQSAEPAVTAVVKTQRRAGGVPVALAGPGMGFGATFRPRQETTEQS